VPKLLADRAMVMLYATKGDAWKLGFPVDLCEHGAQAATRCFADLKNLEKDGHTTGFLRTLGGETTGDTTVETTACNIEQLAKVRDSLTDEEAECVACALLHDIGEVLCPVNHGDVAAAMLRPYISRKMHWALANHEVFQGHYYFDKLGSDSGFEKDAIHRRDKLAGSGGSGSGLGWLGGSQGGAVFAGKEPEGAWELCAKFCERWDAPAFDAQYKSLDPEFFRPVVERVFARTAFWDEPQNLKRGAVTAL